VTQISKSEVKARLVDILANTLGVAPDAITDDFSAEQCGNWDSVRHLTLVLAIEDHFQIAFDEDEIWSLFSLPALTVAIEAQQSA
jgi:acyl carrier protein